MASPRRFFARCLIAAAPPITLWLASVLAFPRGTFSLDPHGALGSSDSPFGFSGRYYPRATLEMTVAGHLADELRFGMPRRVTWETDRYGYRKADTDDQAWDVVIVGDSFAAGAGLQQHQILSEVLERRTGLRTYPLAARDTGAFFADARFVRHPPRWLVIAHVERSVPRQGTVRLDVDVSEPPSTSATGAWALGLYADLTKLGVLHFTRDHVQDAMNRWLNHRFVGGRYRDLVPGGVVATDGSMVFYQGDAASYVGGENAITPAEARRALDVVATASSMAAQRGTKVVYAVIPNKENVYYARLPARRRPRFLLDFVADARARGIAAVDLDTPFHDAVERTGALLYYPNDTHWTPAAVEIAARVLHDELAAD